jgi:hypothetical protein
MAQEMMRDPAGNAARYAEYFKLRDDLKSTYLEKFPALPLDAQVQSKIGYSYDDQEYLVHQYAAGVPLTVLVEATRSTVEELAETFQFIRSVRGGDAPNVHPLNGHSRLHFEFAALALLLLETPAELAQFEMLVSPLTAERHYLLDLMVKAFIPTHALAKKYKTEKAFASWFDPVLRALTMPPEQRPAALAAHMKNWPRIMRPWGLKPQANAAEGTGKLFWHFAFEIALAVCAWDIDDSSFNDHPYYPRDLVEYYRQHIRHTRDSWREPHVGAGVQVIAPPKQPKADLAKSKRKGIARWVELVADGDQDAVDAVLEVTGKPRKVKDFDALMYALQDNDLAVHADIRDDETVEAQVDGLVEARELEQFEAPPGPPFGGTRCTALLRAWDAWLARRGYQAADLDGDDDAWHAVVVKTEYHAELLALSAELGIRVRGVAGMNHWHCSARRANFMRRCKRTH